ncbi:hypothetical protein ACI3L1_10665 [Deinococcus sp. SM5_A1]|uniref:hypothetical protein n=1 Tax=Deinococcus sp. SM5_A1 TaxID=3379094 RepID=UPI00385F8D4D
MLVGGFGLVLRRQWRQEQGEQTLIEVVPPARATEDFDVLLTLEILEDPEQRQAIREALSELGYKILLANLHFIQPGSGTNGRRDIKVDFLAPPVPAGSSTLRERNIRVGPRNSTEQDKLHGYRTPEAELLLGNVLTVPLEGADTKGAEQQVYVDLPHPFMLTLMKLHAFRDEYEGRKTEGQMQRALAAKHLADAYTLTALLTRAESEELIQLASENASHPVVQDAAGIIGVLLADDQTPGTLLLRETLGISADELDIFLDFLHSAYR